MGRVLMVVGSRNFRDEEYFEPRQVFEGAAMEVVTASSREGPVRGALGGWARADRFLAAVRAEDHDAVVFVGGDGAREFAESRTAWRLAQRALEQGRVLAAICMAPLILARAGLLRERRVTAWPGVRDEVARAGAVVVDDPVVVDERLVTADGPQSARQFAEAVLRVLAGGR